MTRDGSARARVRDYLRRNGAIEDTAGCATAVLKDAIGYGGTTVGFIQIVAAMDRDGEIARDVRGKRTYRIALGQMADPALSQANFIAPGRVDDPELTRVSQTAPAGSRPGRCDESAAQPIELDYDALARAIVREFSAAVPLSAGAPAPAPAGSPAARADSQVRSERAEYALRLEIARLRLDALLGDRADERHSALKRLSLDD